MKKALFLIMTALWLAGGLFSCGTLQTLVQVPANVNLPKKIMVVAQSCDANVMYQTVIDLDNDEIVILIYNEMNLLNVIRTGIKTETKNQAPVAAGSDAPSAANSRERLKFGGKQ